MSLQIYRKEIHVRLGIGLYKDMLKPENYRFAKQAGCTDIIAHLANYYTDGAIVPGTDGKTNYGISQIGDEWSKDTMNLVYFSMILMSFNALLHLVRKIWGLVQQLRKGGVEQC